MKVSMTTIVVGVFREVKQLFGVNFPLDEDQNFFLKNFREFLLCIRRIQLHVLSKNTSIHNDKNAFR